MSVTHRESDKMMWGFCINSVVGGFFVDRGLHTWWPLEETKAATRSEDPAHLAVSVV